MGWAMLAGIAVAAGLLLALLRYPWKLWSIPAAALMIAAAGYAWQGSPRLPGHPVSPEAERPKLDQGLVDLRDAMFGKYGTYAWSYANLADGMIRAGKPDLALAVWQGAVRKEPGEPALWTGFGTALAEHDGNQISPSAQYAFDRAFAIAPKHPGPAFFYGLALIRGGKYAEALPWWEKAVAFTPEKASYRRDMVLRLIALEVLVARMQGMQAPPAK